VKNLGAGVHIAGRSIAVILLTGGLFLERARPVEALDAYVLPSRTWHARTSASIGFRGAVLASAMSSVG
jgi:hypothetical protein